MFITIGIFTPMYSISLFLPTIITQFGYSANKSQLLTVPPYLAACLCTILGNYAADRLRQRGLFLLGFELLAIIGFLMLVTNDMPHVQYVGFFFAASGKYQKRSLCSCTPLILTQRDISSCASNHHMD